MTNQRRKRAGKLTRDGAIAWPPLDTELLTRNPEEPAGQADVVADLLAVLKHPKPHLGFADLLLRGDHAGPPLAEAGRVPRPSDISISTCKGKK